MDQITEETWMMPLREVRNLGAQTLGAALGDEPTLLVFLRHLG